MPLKTDIIEEPHLNLTPMIDIVFLLVIFFMVGTQFTDEEDEQKYDVNLPTVTSSALPLTARPDEITIAVAADGKIFVDGQPRTLAELEQDLRAKRKAYAGQTVLVRGDGQGRYQYVMDVLAVCDRAGIENVSLANRRNTEVPP